ncbi:MAG TPA: dihydrolipoamide acetyltransferase family protein [Ilumatobacteraceae bacterium]|nr:dihydrolipoamide acetyltransferase family protein [Ilumatobacteraceae bacterium]
MSDDTSTADTVDNTGTFDDTGTFDYALPSLGADMDVGRVVEWRVAIGDEVSRGDVMAVVETEKSDIDIEIWHDGVVQEFLVDLREEIPVGTPIVRLGGRGPSAAPAPAAPSEVRQPSAAPSPSPLASSLPPPPAAAAILGDRVPSSPRARRVAAERGIDLADVVGTGPGGAVVAADVPAPGAVPAAVATTPEVTEGAASPDRMRALIAARMTQSNRDIPHYHLAVDVDVTTLERWLQERNEARPIGERVLPAAAYVRAVALAAADHPELNGRWVEDRFVPAEGVNVAMAVSLRRGGLMTPNIEHTDQRSLDEIMAALREHVAAARTGSLKARWMTGATITVTNLGDHGADLVHGVISPPEVALVGIGRPTDRPWVVDGAVTARRILTLTLAADHRATDGVTGSRFLRTVAHLLEHPEEL